MSDTAPLSLPDAASRLGVSVRILRAAIRAGRLPAPGHLTATSAISSEWLANAQAAGPDTFSGTKRPRVPAFARYEGTSAWRKYRVRVREFALFQKKEGK